jgi:hypothetical protein
MSLLFQYPALLGLLALAGVPVLVHLLSRARPPVYRFSNIEFLRRVMRNTARFRRPKDWLLLALRVLALFAMAAAFASPFLVSKSASLPGEKTTIILLVDRSASMAAREGAGSRFDAACAHATRFLDESGPNQANLIWIDAEPDAVFPEPGPNIRFLTDLLQQAKPTPEIGSLAAAFDLALRQLSQADGHRELVIISDFQATAWRDFSPALPENIVVRTQNAASTTPSNTAVSRLIPQPAEPVAGQDITILARVRNFAPDPVRTQITLDADGARQSQPIDLPAWGEAECVFTLRPANPGPLPISASVESDAFPADDSRHAVLKIRDSLRLAITSAEDSGDSRILTKLASSLSWLEIPADPTNTRPADFHFISSWSGDQPADLRKSALNGTTLIVRPAPSSPLESLRTLLDLPADPVAGLIALDASPAGWSVIPEESHPANHLFRTGDFGNPFGGVFRERLKLPASLATESSLRPIALFSDGVPALLEHPTQGASILIWNLPLDPAKTDWPVQGSFLPAIAEILLRTRTGGGGETTYALPGSPLTWTSNDPAHAGAISLLGPSSEPLEVSESTTPDGTLWQSTQPATPGLHRWQISGQPIAYTAVNFPDSESDLRPLDVSPTFGKVSSPADSLVRQAALARGLQLWPWLALTALLALAMESFIHARSVVRTT